MIEWEKLDLIDSRLDKRNWQRNQVGKKVTDNDIELEIMDLFYEYIDLE